MMNKNKNSASEINTGGYSRRLMLVLALAILTPLIAPHAEETSSKSSVGRLGAGALSLKNRCADFIKKAIKKLDSKEIKKIDATPTPLGKPGSPLPRNAIAERIKFIHMKEPFRAEDYERSRLKQKKLEKFEKLKSSELDTFLRDEFSKAIESGYDLLSPRDLQDFHEAVRDFLTQGGHFVIDQDLEPQMRYGAFFYFTKKGDPAVNIPYVDILKSAEGDREEKQTFVGTMLHEVRHYVTYIRVAKSLEKKGLTRSEARAYMTRLEGQPDSQAYHIDQLEQEARAIERRTFPHTIENNIQAFLYADVEALQRWTKAYLSPSIQGSLENLSKQPVAIRLADRIASHTEEYLMLFSDGRELSDLLKYNLQEYVNYLSKNDKSLGRQVLFRALVAHMFQGIKGRLDPDTEESLKSFVLMRIQTHPRRLDSAIQKLLKAHPEIKPHEKE